MLRTLLTFCAAAAFAACGDSSAPKRDLAAAPAARIELELQARTASDPSFGVTMPWPDDASAWTGKVVRDGPRTRLSGPASARFPGAIVPRTSPALSIPVKCDGPGSAVVVMSHSRGDASRTLSWKSAATLHARFELDGEPLEALVVRFESLDGQAARALDVDPPILELALSAKWAELLHSDPTRRISAQFGLESRSSIVLQPGRRWVGRGIVPADGASFTLEYGALELNPGANLQVRAILRFESGARIDQRLPLGAQSGWSAWSTELEEGAGNTFEVTLELIGPSHHSSLVAVPSPLVHAREAAPRTVLLVTSDTHRADHVEGAPRGVNIQTPALRELAARGITFTDCWSSSNITVPSHVAMLSGLHPRDTGVTDNQTMLSDEARILPEVFRDAGWATFAVTSINLLAPAHAGIGQGFDRVIAPLATRNADKTVDAALRLLDETPDRSVFFWVHVFDAHGPYEPPAPFDTKFYPAGRNPRDPNIAPEDGMRVPPYLPGVRDAEFVRALYRGEIASADHQLARLFAHPRVQSGIVGFTGDHGEVLGHHDIWWAHKDVYPDTLHVPLIVVWPGAPAGRASDAPVTNVDLARTLLDVCGFEAPEFPGRSFARVDELDTAKARFALSGARMAASITREGWHLILQLAKSDEPEHKTHRELHQIELFSLRDDPECAHDRAGDRTELARELRAELVRWLSGWKGERLVGMKRTDAATLENLAQLGYASNANSSDASAPLIDPQCVCRWCSSLR